MNGNENASAIVEFVVEDPFATAFFATKEHQLTTGVLNYSKPIDRSRMSGCQ